MDRTGYYSKRYKRTFATDQEYTQYRAWNQLKAQATYRKDGWELQFEEFLAEWQDHWHERGKHSNDYTLMRLNPDESWNVNNIRCCKRAEHLARQKLYKKARYK